MSSQGAAWIALAYLCGSLPLSVWLGRLALRRDIRQYGDGNPGAFNVMSAGGLGWGAVAALLDFAKGVAPVAVANFHLGLSGWTLVAVALAPVLGHATSPFLRFRGGKGLAVSFGVWCGLSLYVVPLALGALLALWLRLVRNEGWAVAAGMASMLMILLLFNASPVWLAVCLGDGLVLATKHYTELAQLPRLRFVGRRSWK